MATIVYLKDLHEIDVSLQLNTYPIYDLALCGSDKYPASAYPSNCSLIHLNKIDSYQLFLGGTQYMLDTIPMSLGLSKTVPS